MRRPDFRITVGGALDGRLASNGEQTGRPWDDLWMSEGQAGGPGPVRVFLDTQQFNYFAEPGSGPHPPEALRWLKRAVRGGQVEVVGSLDVLQELLEAARAVPKKSARMVDLFFQLVRHRVLLPTSVRGEEERINGLLADPDMYLERGVLREARRRAQSKVEALSLAKELRQSKDAFLRQEQMVQRKAKERLQAAA